MVAAGVLLYMGLAALRRSGANQKNVVTVDPVLRHRRTGRCVMGDLPPTRPEVLTLFVHRAT